MPALPLLTVIRSKLALAAIVPLLCPAEVQGRNTLLQPCSIRLALPPVVVLKVPVPVVDVQLMLPPSVDVRLPVVLDAILKLVAALTCAVSADAIAGRAKNAAPTTASASTIIFLLMFASFLWPCGWSYGTRGAVDRGQ